MSDLELKPCPFCGSNNIRLTWEWTRKAIINGRESTEGSAYVTCDNCGASTAQFFGAQKDSGDFCCGLEVLVHGERRKLPWAFPGTIKEKAADEWNRREDHGYKNI